jgi:hypothetical protein
MDPNHILSLINSPMAGWAAGLLGIGVGYKRVLGWISSALAWSQDAKNAKLIKDANSLADDLLEKMAAAGHPDLAGAETTLNAIVAQLPQPTVKP